MACHKVMAFTLLICAFALAGPPQSPAGKAGRTGKKLDTALVHKTYLDGDFDRAIDLLESGMKYGAPLTHEDSVFAFKHLGVMYAAKYETREKGKAYMMKLLHVEPTARIMDMYASDMIYMIFKNIQDEFEVSQAKLRRADEKKLVDTHSFKSDTSAMKQARSEKPPRRSRAWLGWTAGALAAAGGVVLFYHLNEENEPPTAKENRVP